MTRRPPRTVMVENGSVRLAVSDLGGTGPTIVLLPGLGLTRRSLVKVARLLHGWRVVTVDLRGHGRSSSGPWSFEAAVSDLDAVVRHLGLDSPWVGGHSLGGMIALQYALSGRPVSGVVNVDGWGPGVPSRFPGEDEAKVAALLDSVDGGLPRLARWATSFTRQAREGTTASVLRALHGADVVAWHRSVPCPSLAFNAIGRPGRLGPLLLGRETARLQAAHRRGLQRDLALAAEEQPLLHVVEVDAGHLLVSTHPAVVATAIDEFHATVTA